MHVRTKTPGLLAFIILAAVLLSAVPVSSQAGTTLSTSDELIRFYTVVVSRYGFNDTMGPLVINVTEGDRVHITFLYGDADLVYDNPHVIFLQGYDLRTSVISRSNPTATLEFIASKTGSFAFYCVIPCEGMLNLEEGRIDVERRPMGLSPTALKLSIVGTPAGGQEVSIAATLTQAAQPVANVHVDFYVETAFGPMRVGTAITDQKGVALISYRFVSGGEYAVVAKFEGTRSLAPSEDQLEIFVEHRGDGSVRVSILPGLSGESISTLPYVQGQNWMPDLRLVGVPLQQGVPVITLILLTVGSVWVAYVYVFAQIRAIVRGSTGRATEEKVGEGKLESTPPKKGFDKRILLGVVLVAVVLLGGFAYYQFGTAPQPKTETIKIDIKMLMQGGEERRVFDPLTITVHKGDHIILIVTNIDEDAIHGVVIPELNLNTGPVGPTQQAKLEFDATTTGTFTILCPVPGCAPDHAQMIAQLVVV